MEDSTDIETRLDALAQEVRESKELARSAQDKLDVLNLIAESAYLVDAEAHQARMDRFQPDGTFDLIPQEAFPSTPDWEEGGLEDVVSYRADELNDSWPDALKSANRRGLSHFPGQAHVRVAGDEAVVLQHIATIERDPTAEPIDVTPHGMTRGFRVLQVGTNLFHCKRKPGGWYIARRSYRVNSGGEARKMLASWAAEL